MSTSHLFQQNMDKSALVRDPTPFDVNQDWYGQANSGPATVGRATFAAAAAPAQLTQILYLAETAAQAPINVMDINQDGLGDCYLLSSIGEIALLRPSFITNMIHVNANGTETVGLYTGSNGNLPTWNTPTSALKAVGQVVSNVFDPNSVNSGATQDVANGLKEIWPQVIEKAYAQLNGGYNNISNGGSPLVAMAELTGHASTYSTPATMSLASLMADQNAGDMMVFDTKASGALTNGLYNNHAYMFDGITGGGSSAMVHLLNPWGSYEPSAIAFSTLSKSIVEIDINHV
jgi:hypothetical protein